MSGAQGPIKRDSVEFRILQKLCTMPPPVRGVSSVMLNRAFSAPDAIEDLLAAGLIRPRGWHSGPGALLIPTAEGEAVYRRLLESQATDRTD